MSISTVLGFARNPINSQSRRPVAKVLRSRAERRCCVSAQRASSSHSLAQRAREIATKPSFRPNGSAVHLQCTLNGRPVGPENMFLFADLALQARLLERMALWAGNAVEWSSECFSAEQRSQRLLGSGHPQRSWTVQREMISHPARESWCQ